ncbi:hypothetical protein Tco_0046231 [Tanacetum coccineum]
MTTGSSIWTIGGWTSLVISLGSTVSFVTSVSIPPPEVEFEVIYENTPSAIPTVLVLVPTILIVGLAVVLHGRKTGWSDLVCHRWRTVTGISLVEICCGCLRDVFLDVISREAGMDASCLSRSRVALTSILSIQQNIGRYSRVGEAPRIHDVDMLGEDL